MAKKCLSNKEFQEVLELLGKQVFRDGSIYQCKGITQNCDKSIRHLYALFVYSPEFPKLLDTLKEKFGENIKFEVIPTPNKDFSKSRIEDYIELYKLNNRFTITEQTPILELKVRGYCSEF